MQIQELIRQLQEVAKQTGEDAEVYMHVAAEPGRGRLVTIEVAERAAWEAHTVLLQADELRQG
jgi:hypothetical protein